MQNKLQVASTISTGGGGGEFEKHLGAAFLAFLLTKSSLPIYPDSIPRLIHFQAKRLGWEVDDLVIESIDSQGNAHKIAVQAKRDFSISTSDELCAKVFTAAWSDFSDSELFDPGSDALVLVVYMGTNRILGDLRALLEQCRASNSEQDFQLRLQGQGALNARSKKDFKTIQSILNASTGQLINDAQLCAFLKCFYVLSYDFTNSSSQSAAVVQTLLRAQSSEATTSNAASNTWNGLVVLAGEAAYLGKSYEYEHLPETLRLRHDAVSTSENKALTALKAHSKIVFDRIRHEGIGGLNFPRADLHAVLDEVFEAAQIVMVVGAAGSGKSALAKNFILQRSVSEAVFAFAAEELNAPHIDTVLANAQIGLNWDTLQTLLPLHAKSVFIDGIERLLESNSRGAFEDLLRATQRNPTIRLLITCRDYSAETVENWITTTSGVVLKRVVVSELNDDELKQAEAVFSQLKPLLNTSSLRSLLRNPFILGQVARLEWSPSQPLPQTERALRARLWRDVVREDIKAKDDMPNRREKIFISICRERAQSLRPYVSCEDDGVAKEQLLQKNVLASGQAKQVAPAHDVFEDWALIEWLSLQFVTCEQNPCSFAENMGAYPAMRRAYRKWLQEMLESEPEQATEYLSCVIGDSSISDFFKDDTLVAVFQSSRIDSFLARFGAQLFENNAQLVIRAVHLVRVACKVVSKFYAPRDGEHRPIHVPAGKAWATLLKFINDNWEGVPNAHHPLVIGFIEDWANGISPVTPYPEGCESAGVLVVKLIQATAEGYRQRDQKEKLFELMLKFPKSAEAFFKEMVVRTKANHLTEGGRRRSDDDDATVFTKAILKRFAVAAACRDFPDQVIELFEVFWLLDPDADLVRHSYSHDIDQDFGLSAGYKYELFPVSAYQGPFWNLLQWHPRQAIPFVIRLVNQATAHYASDSARSRYAGDSLITELTLADGSTKQIFFDERLWLAYAGLSVTPNVFQCALIALEKWLLEIVVMDDLQVHVEGILRQILRDTNSAALIAVVASVCMAHPNKVGDIAVSVLGCRAFYKLDMARALQHALAPAVGGADALEQAFQQERVQANKLPHRRKDLESLCRDLQLTDKRVLVHVMLDRYRSKLPAQDLQDDGDRMWRLCLDRMDLRQYEAERTADGQSVMLRMKPIDADIQQVVDAAEPNQTQTINRMRLMNWSRNQWEKNKERANETQDWSQMLALARSIYADHLAGVAVSIFDNSGINTTAAVGIRDHWDAMPDEDRDWCRMIVLGVLQTPPSTESDFTPGNPFNGACECASVLFLMLAREPKDATAQSCLFLTLCHFNQDIQMAAVGGVSDIWKAETDEIFKYGLSVLLIHAKSQTDVQTANSKIAWNDRPNELQNWAAALTVTEEAIDGADVAGRLNISNLSFVSWHEHQLCRALIRLFQGHSDKALAFEFFSQLAAVVASWWAVDWDAESRRHGGHNDEHLQRDYELESLAEEALAEFALRMNPDTASLLLSPIFAAIDKSPEGCSSFLEQLVHAMNNHDSPVFWKIWSQFAQKLRVASWQSNLDSERSEGRELVRYSFINMRWNSGVREWARLGIHYADVDAHFEQSPRSNYALECYVAYLYQIGAASLPSAFTRIAQKFTNGLSEAIGSELNLKFHLESLLSKVLFGKYSGYTKKAENRDAVLLILDALVASGSSIAFQLRDDFVTPTAIRVGE